MKYLIFAVGLLIASACPTHAFAQGRFTPLIKVVKFIDRQLVKHDADILKGVRLVYMNREKIQTFHEKQTKMKQRQEFCLYNFWEKPKKIITRR